MTYSEKSTTDGVLSIEPAEFDLDVDVDALKSDVECFGFCGAHNAINVVALAKLKCDAGNMLAVAEYAEQAQGAELAYRAEISGLGPYMKLYMQNPQILKMLKALFDGDFALTTSRSCLTCYRAGDHLGAHTDQPPEECDVTVIAYLDVVSGDNGFASPDRPRLNVYGREKPLPDEQPKLVIASHPGTFAIGRGSKFWHERPRLSQTQSVIALTGCFHAL